MYVCDLQQFFCVSGGASCRKSQLIKCIDEEATKIVRQLPSFFLGADMSTPAMLLAAFTGMATFHIAGKTKASQKLETAIPGPGEQTR